MRGIDQRRAVLMIKWEGSGAPLTVAMDAHVLLVNRRSLTYVDAHPSRRIYLEGEAEVKSCTYGRAESIKVPCSPCWCIIITAEQLIKGRSWGSDGRGVLCTPM